MMLYQIDTAKKFLFRHREDIQKASICLRACQVRFCSGNLPRVMLILLNSSISEVFNCDALVKKDLPS